jgi:WD40 repeat protein
MKHSRRLTYGLSIVALTFLVVVTSFRIRSTLFLVREFSGDNGTIFSVVFSPSGRYVLSGSGNVWRKGGVTPSAIINEQPVPIDCTMRLWDAESGEELRCFQGHTHLVNSVAFSPDCERVASASSDGTVRLWDLESGQEVRCIVGHDDAVSGVVFLPDGRRLASCSWDGSIRLWDIETGKQLHCFRPRYSHLHFTTVCVAGSTGRLVGGAWGTSHVWDLESKEEILPDRDAPGGWSIALSPDGRYAVSAAPTGIILWDVETKAQIHVFEGYSSAAKSLSFSPDGHRILSGHVDGSIRLWDVESGAILRSFKGTRLIGVDEVLSVGFSPDGRFGISGGHSEVVRLWRLP